MTWRMNRAMLPKNREKGFARLLAGGAGPRRPRARFVLIHPECTFRVQRCADAQGGQESNLQPAVLETAALQLSYRPRDREVSGCSLHSATVTVIGDPRHGERMQTTTAPQAYGIDPVGAEPGSRWRVLVRLSERMQEEGAPVSAEVQQFQVDSARSRRSAQPGTSTPALGGVPAGAAAERPRCDHRPPRGRRRRGTHPHHPVDAESGEFVLRDDGVGLTLTEVAVSAGDRRPQLQARYLRSPAQRLPRPVRHRPAELLHGRRHDRHPPRSARGGALGGVDGQRGRHVPGGRDRRGAADRHSVHLVPRVSTPTSCCAPRRCTSWRRRSGVPPVRVTIDTAAGDIDITRDAPFSTRRGSRGGRGLRAGPPRCESARRYRAERARHGHPRPGVRTALRSPSRRAPGHAHVPGADAALRARWTMCSPTGRSSCAP